MRGSEDVSERFEQAIRNIDVVSFDVFGTLLKRSCKDESFVFDLAFSKWGCADLELDSAFARARRLAGNDEYAGHIQGLDEIYGRIPFLTDGERDELAACEMECERSVLFANEVVHNLYRIALSKGKRVVATSDMYLPSRFVAAVLEENGYHALERVFVSCEERVDKQSGKLISTVARELDVEPGRILHVGDSLRSDVLGARRAGVKCFYVGEHRVGKADAKATLAIGHGRLPNALYDVGPSKEIDAESEFSLGYGALGPLLVSFCYWIIGEAGKERHLFFLARDAQLIMSMCEILFPRDVYRFHYLRVSRKTLNSLALCECESLLDVRNYVGLPRFVTPKSFSGAAGIGGVPGVAELFSSVGMMWDEAIDRDCFFRDKRLISISDELVELIRDCARAMNEKLRAYLLQEGLRDGSCLVDVGWHGSAQRSLEAASGHSLTGLYLGTSDTSELDARGFLYDDGVKGGDSLMAGYWGLFESLFATGDGITCGYAEEGGRLVPILAEPELTDESIGVVRRVQHGAMEFACWYAETIGRNIVGGDFAKEALARIQDIGEHPGLRDINKYGNIEFRDFDIVRPIVGRPKRLNYIRDPHLLKRDFYESTWRIGFMKRVFLLPLDYSFAFRIARRLFGGDAPIVLSSISDRLSRRPGPCYRTC